MRLSWYASLAAGWAFILSGIIVGAGGLVAMIDGDNDPIVVQLFGVLAVGVAAIYVGADLLARCRRERRVNATGNRMQVRTWWR